MKKSKKVISLILSVLMIVSVFSVNAFALDMKDTTLAMFQYYNSTKAINAINSSSLSPYIFLGNDDDATNIYIAFKFLDMIDDCNEIRAKEGLPALLVTDAMMAYAQADADWSGYHLANTGYLDHARVFNCGENIAWNYGIEDYDGNRDVVTSNNPFEGWYDEERQIYLSDSSRSGECGHYFNIINDQYEVTGFAYNAKYHMFSQTFGFADETDLVFTTDQYRQRIDDYYKAANGLTGRYWDVPNYQWYFDPIEKVSDLGYFSGYQDGSFGPGNNIIRQDFAVVMSKVAGVDLSSQSTANLKFPDINKNDYYANSLAWCVENKIISGYGDGRFGPADAITREQICVMIYKFMTNVKSKEDISENDVNTVLAKFSDQNNISDWARHAVAWCVQNKVISGAQGGKFVNPVSNANRAEIAQMLYSMSNNGLI